MYARYIPPPKTAIKATVSKPIEPLPPSDGYSYARYVPGGSAAASAENAKRKREGDDGLPEEKRRARVKDGDRHADDRKGSTPKGKGKKKKARTSLQDNSNKVVDEEADGKEKSTEKEKKTKIIASPQEASKAADEETDGQEKRKKNNVNTKEQKKPSDEKRDEIKIKESVQYSTIKSTDEKTDQQEESRPEKRSKSKTKPQQVEPATTDDEADRTRHKAVLNRKNKSLSLATQSAQDVSSTEQDHQVEQHHSLQPLPQPAMVATDDIKPTARDALPPWLARPTGVSQSSRKPFQDLGIAAKAARVLAQRGFKEAFAIQTAAIPLLLPSGQDDAGDVLISAATGSGKTLAYALPIVRDVGRAVVTRLRALIVLPTRELVKQAHDVFETCARAYDGVDDDGKKVRIGVAVGSQSVKTEHDTLLASESRYDPDAYDTLSTADDTYSGTPRPGAWEGEVIDSTSRVDILICTPGRLVDHLEQTPGFTLNHLRWLVVDEADKLLSLSFQGWLDRVQERIRCPSSTGCCFGARDSPHEPRSGVRKVVVSATLTRDPGLLHRLSLRRPRLLVLDGDDERGDEAEHALPTSLAEFAVRVHEPGLKPLYLLALLRSGHMEAGLAESGDLSRPGPASQPDDNSSGPNPSSSSSPPPPPSTWLPPHTLIFTKSNESALRLSRLLSLLHPKLSHQITTLTSTTPTSTRRKTLRSFSSPSPTSPRLVVASDLVARGIDVPQLGHVVNYDVPATVAGYVHRVGRTARAGRRGCAWTLLPDPDSGWFWGRIAKGKGIRRASMVQRILIEGMGEDEIRRYDEALAELGREAVEMKRG
ncbi:ATP-dependent RNA helicase dbp6 [Ophiocordyceps camponoti-floridani]|uniref:ATP-dependent RNA helicase n=1 Tax=Ophiocordyceps camponoti-floridani TaxID=2030778 RepID=A0A8H4Q4T4_9HYPO|nr:ATP-dependent RNA helicase dbp6 [Ophiocordyceps camponoti-floridani]